MQKNKIYGVVILYNPSIEVLSNVDSYLSYIDKLYAVDNSEQQNIELVNKLKEIDKIEYIWNKENLGIGYALNLAARKAINEGANWLLTMDQDSQFIGDGFQKLIQFVNSTDTSDIGIISPYHWVQGEKLPSNDSIHEVLRVMTSGNLLNLEIFEKIGPFREEYFIDFIDHEYCLRLRRNGYKIIVHNGAVLKHRLGNITTHWGIFRTTNHSVIRRYYITRNRLYVTIDYFFDFPLVSLRVIYHLLIDWIKIILFEEKKMKKQKMILKGIIDFLKNRTGKIEYKNSYTKRRG